MENFISYGNKETLKTNFIVQGDCLKVTRTLQRINLNHKDEFKVQMILLSTTRADITFPGCLNSFLNALSKNQLQRIRTSEVSLYKFADYIADNNNDKKQATTARNEFRENFLNCR